MLLADFALVFTLIGDVVSGGVGEASSISSFGLIRDAGAAHVFFLSPGLACATWLGASVGGASAGLVGDFTGGTTLDEPVVAGPGQSSTMAPSWVFHWLAIARYSSNCCLACAIASGLIFLAGGSVGSMARFMAGDS